MVLDIRQKPDFIARVKYFTAEQGGRKSPAHSKYRPIIEFSGHEMLTSGEQIFIGKDIVHPGETVQAQITIASVGHFKEKLFVGQTFKFFESPQTIIGTGEILEILNKDLKIRA